MYSNMKLNTFYLTLFFCIGNFRASAQEIGAGGGIASHMIVNTTYESRNLKNKMPRFAQFSAGIYDWNKRKKHNAIIVSFQQYNCNLYSEFNRHGWGTEYTFKQKRSSLSIAHLPIGIGFFKQKCTLRLGYGFNIQLSNQSTGIYHDYNHRNLGYYDTSNSFSYSGSKGFGTSLSFALMTSLQVPLYHKNKSYFYARAHLWSALTSEINTHYDWYAPIRSSLELHYAFQIFSDSKRKSIAERRQVKTNKYTEKRSQWVKKQKDKRADISNQNIEIYPIFGLNTAHYRHPKYKSLRDNSGLIGLGLLVSPQKNRKIPVVGIELTSNNIRIDADNLSFRDTSLLRNFSIYYIGIYRLGMIAMPLKTHLAHGRFFLGFGVKANYNFYSNIYENFSNITFQPGNGKDPYFGNGQAHNLKHASISTYTTASIALKQRKNYNLKLKFTHTWSPITEVKFDQYLFSSMQTTISLVLGFEEKGRK